MRAIISASMCLLCMYSAHSHALGDLMMTQQQRAQINYLRGKDTSLIEKIIGPEKEKVEAMQVNGFFFKNRDQREEGVVWINGKQVADTESDTGVQVEKINEREKTVSVTLEQTSTSAPLKAGQKIILQNGAIQDAFEP